MALIEVYHVVADYYPVAALSGIAAGMVVTLTSTTSLDDLNENSVIAKVGTSGAVAIGLAGDSGLSAAGKTTPYSYNLVVNSAGSVATPNVINSKRWTSDRVSDMYDETLSSSKMTVYNQGGKFRVDTYEGGSYHTGGTGTWTPGTKLYASGTTSGLIDDVTTSNALVGITTSSPNAFPSGVPGTDVEDGSMSLGTFLTFILKL